MESIVREITCPNCMAFKITYNEEGRAVARMRRHIGPAVDENPPRFDCVPPPPVPGFGFPSAVEVVVIISD